MLQIFPERLLDYAVDDVIQAASLHQSTDAERIAAFARRRIANDLEQARVHADELRATAAVAGYRDGLSRALAALQPMLHALRDEQLVLSRAVATHVQQALRDMAGAPDIVVEQVCAAFQARTSSAAPAGPSILHVPQDQAGLLDALRADPRLAGLQIRASARRLPLLEVGPMAWELDMEGAMGEDIAQALDQEMPGVGLALAALATRYSQQLLGELERAAQAKGLACLKEHR